MQKSELMSIDFIESIFDTDDELDIERKYNEYLQLADTLKCKTEFKEAFRSIKKLKTKELKEARKQEAEKRRQETAEYHRINRTEFAHPKYPELKSTIWECDWRGVRTDSAYDGEIWACKHPIMPVEVLQNIQTKKEKVKIAFKRRRIWREHVFDRSVISSTNKIVSMLPDYGVAVTSETAKYLVKYLSEIELMNEQEIAVKDSTSKMGWFDGDFIPFTDREIVFDAESSFESVYKSIGEKGSRERYIEHIKKVRQHDKDDVRFAMAVSVASVLIQPLGILPFILHMYGLGGRGKTVSAMVASSIWGDPHEGAFMADAKSTTTAFEMRLNFLNNLPLICDDLSQLRKNSQESDFSKFIYSVCSGRGSERSNVNLGLNAVTTWRNTTLTNAEKPIIDDSSNGGEILRVIDFEASAGDLFEDAKLTADLIKQNYGFIGKEITQKIKELGIDAIKEMYDTWINKIREADTSKSKESKQIFSMASILLADELLERHIFKDGITLDFKRCFDLIKSSEQMNDNERAYGFILSNLSMHRMKFLNRHAENWGFFNGKIAYINTNIFSQWAKDGNFDKKMFMRWAVNNDKGEVNEKDRGTVKVANAKMSSRFYCIKMEHSITAEQDLTDGEHNTPFSK